MKNKSRFPKVVGLLSLFLFLSPTAYAQSNRNPETDLTVTSNTQSTTLYVTVKNKSPNTYDCVRIEFDLYDRVDRRPPGAQRKHLGVFSVEPSVWANGESSSWVKLTKEADWGEAVKKSVTDCWASAASQKVTLYEDANFGGRSTSLGVNGKGDTLVEFNDLTSSIEVPTGLVAIVYEDAGAGVGYGRYVDFLENQPDLAKYDFDNRISYIHIFPSERRWVRNALNNGRFERGYSMVGARPAPNPKPYVAPPKPKPVTTQPTTPPTTQPTTPVFCTITGEVKNYQPKYLGKFRIILRRPDRSETGFSANVAGRRYTISNVPEGTYEIEGVGRYSLGTTPSGRPASDGIFSDESQQVTCKNGRSNSVTFVIRSFN